MATALLKKYNGGLGVGLRVVGRVYDITANELANRRFQAGQGHVQAAHPEGLGAHDAPTAMPAAESSYGRFLFNHPKRGGLRRLGAYERAQLMLLISTCRVGPNPPH